MFVLVIWHVVVSMLRWVLGQILYHPPEQMVRGRSQDMWEASREETSIFSTFVLISTIAFLHSHRHPPPLLID